MGVARCSRFSESRMERRSLDFSFDGDVPFLMVTDTSLTFCERSVSAILAEIERERERERDDANQPINTVYQSVSTQLTQRQSYRTSSNLPRHADRRPLDGSSAGRGPSNNALIDARQTKEEAPLRAPLDYAVSSPSRGQLLRFFSTGFPRQHPASGYTAVLEGRERNAYKIRGSPGGTCTNGRV